MKKMRGKTKLCAGACAVMMIAGLLGAPVHAQPATELQPDYGAGTAKVEIAAGTDGDSLEILFHPGGMFGAIFEPGSEHSGTFEIVNNSGRSYVVEDIRFEGYSLELREYGGTGAPVYDNGKLAAVPDSDEGRALAAEYFLNQCFLFGWDGTSGTMAQYLAGAFSAESLLGEKLGPGTSRHSILVGVDGPETGNLYQGASWTVAVRILLRAEGTQPDTTSSDGGGDTSSDGGNGGGPDIDRPDGSTSGSGDGGSGDGDGGGTDGGTTGGGTGTTGSPAAGGGTGPAGLGFALGEDDTPDGTPAESASTTSAPPEDEADSSVPGPVDLPEDDPPLGLVEGGAGWSLLNLVLSLLAMLGAVVVAVLALRGRKAAETAEASATGEETPVATAEDSATTPGPDTQEDDQAKAKRWPLVLRILCYVLAVLCPILFFLLEDMTTPMVFVNRFTPLFIALYLAHLCGAVLGRKRRADDTGKAEAPTD